MTAWVTTSARITSAADESEKALEAALFSRRTVASTQQWALAAILCRGQCLWEYAREVVCRFLLSHLSGTFGKRKLVSLQCGHYF